MPIDEVLIVRNKGIDYAIESSRIDQILKVPEITPTFISPKEVSGLCPVGGNIITAIDSCVVLELGRVDLSSEESRLLTVPGSNMAILVDAVRNSVEVNSKNLEHVDNSDDAVEAIYRYGDEIIQVLSIDKLFNGIHLPQIEKSEIKTGNRKSAQERIKRSSTNRFLIFQMADEVFAFEIELLREVIVPPQDYNEIAGSDKCVLGMIMLRNELLTVIDLRTYYSFDKVVSDKNRVLIIHVNGRKMGVLVEKILDIEDYEVELIDSMPANFEDRKISGVIHDEKHLISMVGSDVLEELASLTDRFGQEKEDTERDHGKSEDIAMEAVIFKLGNEEYAVDIEKVAEIIDYIPLVSVADAPPLIEGVINIRGKVVTVGSLFEKLHIRDGKSEDQKIIVCHASNQVIGFRVDDVSDVMGIEKSVICSNEEDDELVPNILHLNGGKRLIMLLDLEKVF